MGATAIADPPPPPPGFTLDDQQAAPPPPPPGFTLDGQAQQGIAPPSPASAVPQSPDDWLSARMQQGVNSEDELGQVLDQWRQRGGAPDEERDAQAAQVAQQWPHDKNGLELPASGAAEYLRRAIDIPSALPEDGQLGKMRQRTRDTLAQIAADHGLNAAAQDPRIAKIAFDLVHARSADAARLTAMQQARANSTGTIGTAVDLLGQGLYTPVRPFVDIVPNIAAIAGSSGAQNFLNTEDLASRQAMLEGANHPYAGGAAFFGGNAVSQLAGPGAAAFKGASLATDPAVSAFLGEPEMSAIQAARSGEPAMDVLLKRLPKDAIRGGANNVLQQAGLAMVSGKPYTAKDAARDFGLGAVMHVVGGAAGKPEARAESPEAAPEASNPQGGPASPPETQTTPSVPSDRASDAGNGAATPNVAPATPDVAPPDNSVASQMRAALAKTAAAHQELADMMRQAAEPVPAPAPAAPNGEQAGTTLANEVAKVIPPEQVQAARQTVAEKGVVDTRGAEDAKNLRENPGQPAPGGNEPARGEEPRGANLQRPAEASPESAQTEQQAGSVAAQREELKQRASALADGTLIHGTRLSAIPEIAREGVQPGDTYGQGGSSDESAVYGSRVNKGDAGLAGSYSGRGDGETPALVEFKPGLESKTATAGTITLNSPGKSYVRPEDVAAVHIAGHPPMTLQEAVAFARGDQAARENGVRYNGIEKGVRAFTDPQTGTTFHVKLGESIAAKLRQSRENFASAKAASEKASGMKAALAMLPDTKEAKGEPVEVRRRDKGGGDAAQLAEAARQVKQEAKLPLSQINFERWLRKQGFDREEIGSELQEVMAGRPSSLYHEWVAEAQKANSLPPSDAIGQRGLGEGPPGANQIANIPRRSAALAKTALGEIMDKAADVYRRAKGAFAGTRGRFTRMAVQQGPDVAQAFTRKANEPTAIAGDADRTFFRDAFGQGPDAEEKYAKWHMYGEAIRGLRVQEKALAKNPNIDPADLDALYTGPKMTRDEIDAMTQEPWVQKANKIWNEQYSPALTAIRVKQGLLMDPEATNRTLYPIFRNMPTEFEGPAGTDTSGRANKSFNRKFGGKGNYQADPHEATQAIIRGHVNTDATEDLAALIRRKYASKKTEDVLQGNGYVDTIAGKEQELEKIDLGKQPGYESKAKFAAKAQRDAEAATEAWGSMDNGPAKDVARTFMDKAKETALIAKRMAEKLASDERWVPKDIAREWNSLKKPPDARDTLYDRINGAWQRIATTGIVIPHLARVAGLAASRLARTGEIAKPADVLRFLPSWFGSNEAAIAEAHAMNAKPWGDAMQYMLDSWGANRGLGHGAEGEVKKGIANFGHRMIFDPETGGDILARRVVGETFLRQRLGNDAVDRLKADVAGGKLSPLAAAAKVRNILRPQDAIDAGQYVNGTLGFANHRTRSGLLNAMQRAGVPFIGSESGMIPADIGRVATLNTNPEELAKMVKSGRFKQAATAAGAILGSGALGMYAAMNGINYMNSLAQTGKGQWMKDNDDGHKGDLWLAPNLYLGNIDPSLSRGMRLAGAKAAENAKPGDNAIKAAAKGAAMENVNETMSVLAPHLKGAFELLTAAAGSPSTLNVHTDHEGNLSFRKEGWGDMVPLVGNTVNNATQGKPVKMGVAKDAVKGLLGMTLSDTERGNTIKRPRSGHHLR